MADIPISSIGLRSVHSLKPAAMPMEEWMTKDFDGFEASAQIVEAFMSGQNDDVVELLAKIAEAIRDRAIDD
jgi:hypothetical protein